MNKIITAGCVAPSDPKRRITLALFGDSLTNCGYQDQILMNMRASLVAKVPENARSTNLVVRSVNAVHPSAVGGYQMGDAMAAMLMTLMR